MQPDAERPGPLRDENFKRVVQTQHVQYMDERNIDVQIIGPRPFLMMGWMSTGDPAVLDAPDQRRDRQAGLLLPGPLPRLDAAAAERPRAGHQALLDEIDRCKKEWGAMSVYVGPDPEGLRQTPGMDKPYWYPLYEKCERDGLPIIVHGTNHQDPRLTIINQNYQVGFLVEQFIATQLLGFSDVFDRYPELKVIVCHCGGALSRFAPTDNHNFQRDTSKNLFFDTCAYEPTFLEAGDQAEGRVADGVRHRGARLRPPRRPAHRPHAATTSCRRCRRPPTSRTPTAWTSSTTRRRRWYRPSPR